MKHPIIVIVLTCITLLSWQCKKSDECPSTANFPVHELPTADLALNPYYTISHVTFIKNGNTVIEMNLYRSFDKLIPLTQDGTLKGVKCEAYTANYREKSIYYADAGQTNTMSIKQCRHAIPQMDRSIYIELTDRTTSATLPTGAYLEMAHIDSIAKLPEMTVRGKVYHDVFISTFTYTYVPGGQKTDSIYYTLTNGVIRASSNFGEVYELME